MDLAGIRFRNVCKMNHYECTGTSLGKGDYAVVMTDRGPVLGQVVQRLDNVTLAQEKAAYPKVVRAASADDLRAHQENARREAEAYAFCLARIGARKLPMKLIRAEILLDRSKSIFYFTADHRVDFRDLVKDLARELRTRIEMRQIGARDEARLIGGLGSCGLSENCSRLFLRELESVSVRTVKAQGLGMNLTRLSGMCGRLKCCLNFGNGDGQGHDSCARRGASSAQ